jgi:hypothetical protein
LDFTVTDNDIGTYVVNFQPDRAGVYTINVNHLASTAISPIQGSPFVVVCSPGIVCAASSTVVGSLNHQNHLGWENLAVGVVPCMAREKIVFTIEARDSFSNRVTELPVKDSLGKPPKDTFAIKVLGMNGAVAAGGTEFDLTPLKTDGEYDGRFEAWVKVTVTGIYDVHVHLSKSATGGEASLSAPAHGARRSDAASDVHASIKNSPFRMKAVHTMDPSKWVDYSGAGRSKSAQKMQRSIKQLAVLSDVGR